MKFDLSKVLLVTDLDGTLLPHNKILAQKDIDAIEKFRQAGGKFTFATGRVIYAAENYFNQLQLDVPVILNNGGVIYDRVKKEFVMKKILPSSARTMLEKISSCCPSVGIEIDAGENVYVAKMTELEKLHIKITGISPEEKDLKDIPDGWPKVVLTMENEFIPEFMQFVKENDVGGINYINSGTIFVEMLPEGCTKGSALKELVRIENYNDYTVFAVGDYNNDLEMIEYADVGVAPANAIDNVKSKADMVTKSTCQEGAIAEVIQYIFDNSINS